MSNKQYLSIIMTLDLVMAKLSDGWIMWVWVACAILNLVFLVKELCDD